MGEIIALVSLVLFSVNAVITKVASGRLNLNVGFLISIAVNVLFSGLLLLIQMMVTGVTPFRSYGFWMFVLAGFFTSYLGRYLYFDTIAKLGPAKASAIIVTNPLFTLLISVLFLGERLTTLEFVASFVVLAGLFLVSYEPPSRPLQPKERRSWREMFAPGVFLALAGSVSYAMGNITRGIGIQDWNEPIVGGFLGASTGLVLQFVFNRQSRQLLSALRDADRQGIGLYLLSGVLTVSAQIGQIAAMHYISIPIATLITMSQPILVLPLSYFLLKNQEGITARVVAGTLLVFSGIAVILLF